MIKSSIEKFAESIGFEIGTSDDVTQATLINSFCKGITNSMDAHRQETQICYIVDKLDEKSEKVLIAMVEFIRLKREK
jgi:hypothetical protein